MARRECMNEPRGRSSETVRGARGAQREEHDDERRERHHAHLAAHDRGDDRLLLGSGSPPTAWASSRPRWSRIVCAEATRSCSATKATASGSSA